MAFTVGPTAWLGVALLPPVALRRLMLVALVLLVVQSDLPVAHAGSKEEFCTRTGNYAALVVGDRDRGEPYLVAIGDVVEAMSRQPVGFGGFHDTVTDTVVATDIVQRVYRTPAPTVTQAAASIKARCLRGSDDAPAAARPEPAQSPPAAQGPAYQQGLAARQAWETWFAGLTSEYRGGAAYWAGERTLPKPGSCHDRGEVEVPDRAAGCLEARRRLAVSDGRRKTEPEYRNGWNSLPSAGTVPPTQSGAPVALPAALTAGLADPIATSPSNGEPWFLIDPTTNKCVAPGVYFEGVTTPDSLVRILGHGLSRYVVYRDGDTLERSRTAMVTDVTGRTPGWLMAHGQSGCLLATKLTGH